jgi:hypothetical protein
MEERYRDIVRVCILLLLLVNTSAIVYIASNTAVQCAPERIPTPAAGGTLTDSSLNVTSPASIPALPGSSSSADMAMGNVSVNRTPRVPVISGNATPTTRTTPVPTPTPVLLRAGYVRVVSLQNFDMSAALPVISLDLASPPLLIDYQIVPDNMTDVLILEYKTKSTYHRDIVNFTRPYDEAFFAITVKNNDTGEVILEDGYGGSFGLQSPRHIEVRQRGNLSIQIAGNYVNATLSMDAPAIGNTIVPVDLH